MLEVLYQRKRNGYYIISKTFIFIFIFQMKVEMKSYKREPELASIIDSESISLVFCVKLACSDMHGEKKDVVGPQFQE